jgi:hypothetical protein
MSTSWARWSGVLKGFVGGILGMALVLLVVHAWLDHQALHQLMTFITAHAAQIEALKH